jgi:ribosomal protein L7Ae-like RNA K-turn-binding protein
MTWNGTFDILTYMGVEMDIQRLFSKHAIQDEKGQILFDFFDQSGKPVDREVLSLYQSKRSSDGISTLNISETTHSVFISDSFASLIIFANQYKARIAIEEAGFVVMGADFDEVLLKKSLTEIPKNAKVNTIFSSSILGRVMDCKVQDLIHGRDCAYRLSKGKVHLKNLKTAKNSAEHIATFSLRTYCISQGILQTVRTFKPRQNGLESFYQVNKQALDGSK